MPSPNTISFMSRIYMEASIYSIIQWSKTWNILEPEQRCLNQQRFLCNRHLARTLRRRSGSRSARSLSSWRLSPRWLTWWWRRWSYGRPAGLRLDTADLVDIVLHQLGVVELEVSGKGKKLSGWKLFCVSPVHGTLPKKLVVVVVLVLTSLDERYEGNEGHKTDVTET